MASAFHVFRSVSGQQAFVLQDHHKKDKPHSGMLPDSII